jgi:hypothetical protein
MEAILKCEECGFEVNGERGRILMLRVRMLNHVMRQHPDLADHFKEVIEVREVATEQRS